MQPTPVRPRRAANRGPARLRALYDALFQTYGPQHWWPAGARFEVIVGAYLTQNTAWTSVERSLRNLRAYRSLGLAGMRRASPYDLRAWIRPSGFATRKALALRAFIDLLDAEFAGSLTRMGRTPTHTLRPMLLALPGVGPETADAILLYAFGHAVPVADEYLRRIATRHALLESAGPRPIRYADLSQISVEAFAADPAGGRAALFNEFHALVVAVGKAHCSRTPDCAHCPLRFDLPQQVVRKRNAKPH